MITLQDLNTAIAKCQCEDHPNAQTCIKLAAYYTIRDSMFPPDKNEEKQYSFDYKNQDQDYINYDSNTEFAELIKGKKQSDVWPVMDELMSAIRVLEPGLYKGVLRKLRT